MISKVAFIFTCVVATTMAFNYMDVKCQVCKATVKELLNEIAKVNSIKTHNFNDFEDQSMVKSKLLLRQLMDKICSTMDDYAKALHKATGDFILLKLIVDGRMNPETHNVDFVEDGDLNTTLLEHCVAILENEQEAFLKAFQVQTLDTDLDAKICEEQTQCCKHAGVPQEETDEFDEIDENKEEL